MLPEWLPLHNQQQVSVHIRGKSHAAHAYLRDIKTANLSSFHNLGLFERKIKL